MAKRLELQEILQELAGPGTMVKYQPPENIRLNYPCILYKRDGELSDYASNTTYRRKRRYLVTIIDRDPDSLIPEKVANLPYTTFVRAYQKDGLNHDVYSIHY